MSERDKVLAELYRDMVDRRLLFAQPRTSGDLRKEYPELKRFDEFGSASLNQHEMRFVWWYASQSSPFYDIPEADKLDSCIDLSFPSQSLRDAKRAEYVGCRFPTKIKAAIDRMGSLSATARVMNHVMAQKMYERLAINLKQAETDDDPAAYAKMAKDTLAAMEAATRMLEGMGSGVSEEEDKLNEARTTAGALRRHHQNRQ